MQWPVGIGSRRSSTGLSHLLVGACVDLGGRHVSKQLTMSPWEIGLIPFGLFLGSVAQRVTGMGGTLVAAPILVLASGAHVGVTVCLMANVIMSVIIFQRTWRQVRWRRIPTILVGVLGGSALGVATAGVLSGPLLQIAIGSMIVFATTLIAVGWQPRLARGNVGRVAAGGASGFINVLSGSGGPPLAIHAMADRWKHSEFVSTIQVVMIASALLAISLRQPVSLPPWLWLLIVGSVLLGLALGSTAAQRISPKASRHLVVVIAIGGGVAIIWKNVMSL